MSTAPTPVSRNPEPTAGLIREQRRYLYRTAGTNQLAPIATAQKWPWRQEQYGPAWAIPFLPYYLGAYANFWTKTLRFQLQKYTFRLQKLAAYDQLWRRGEKPEWTREEIGFSDAAFAYQRIAGSNPIVIAREPDLESLRRRIPLDVRRVEAWLEARGHRTNLAAEAEAGRLFAVDYRVLQLGLQQPPNEQRTHDSRWRGKYLACPIAVFLEAPGVHAGCDLVPLAIQIDQPQPDGQENPVFHPDDGWGWRIAKAYFQTSDINSHSSVGHVFRGHLMMEPFCLATPRQLPETHPIFVLLRPHTKYTLPANSAAYEYFVNRKKTYGLLYSGTLETSRNISKDDYRSHGFRDLGLRADLERRGVLDVLQVYPFRDDAMLWIEPIHAFVRGYVDLYYASDADIQGDACLQSWAAELMDPARGAVRDMLPDDRLDTKAKLVDLLAQVLYIAGPYHSSQHYAGAYFNRHAPMFPCAAYQPPPRLESERDFARWWKMLPPVAVATKQMAYNDFVEYRFDRFGHYEGYPLGEVEEVKPLVERLQGALDRVETKIDERLAGRLMRYDFLKPSLVTNSANI